MRSSFPVVFFVNAIPSFLFLIILMIFVRNEYALFQFPLDDAWIHRVYSRSIALGNGFSYNTGVQEAGSTSPLWTIISAPSHWLEITFGIDIVVISVKLICLALCVFCIILVQILSLQLFESFAISVVAGVLFSMQPRLLFSALSGMETALFVVLWLAAAVAWMARSWFVVVILLGLAPTTRPEALLLMPFVVLALIKMNSGRVSRLRFFLGVLAGFMPTALWAIFCLYVNGHVFPNTFYIKAHAMNFDAERIASSMAALAQHGVLLAWLLPFACVGFVWLAKKEDKAFLVLLAAMPVFFSVSILCSRVYMPLGYYWTRWTDPAAIVLYAAASIAMAYFVVFIFFHRKERMDLKNAASLIVLLMLGFSIPEWYRNFSDRSHHIGSDARVIGVMNVNMGKWLRENTSPQDQIGATDAGAIRYFSDRVVVDLVGLNNSAILFPGSFAGNTLKLDWVVSFPDVIKNLNVSSPETMRERHRVGVPLEEYTICPCGNQTMMVAIKLN